MNQALTVGLSKVASKPIIKGAMDSDLNQAAKVMAEHKIKRLPIYDGETPVGIVTARDIVEAYAIHA
jgi:CBS domain-containing protein